MNNQECELCKEECSCKITTRQQAPITMVRSPPSAKAQRAIILEAIKIAKKRRQENE